ncbi:MAG: DPP IV N-terminal domain-containing protein [Bacteroidota bacterium]|nr:DPP IV N-terminal domain-containing protein [Bacteroidota bacterium]
MKKLTFLFILILNHLVVFAQQKMLSVDEVVMKQRSSLAPERLAQLQWIPQSNQFTYIGKKEGKEVLIVEKAETLVKDTLLTIDEFSMVVRNLLKNEKPITKFPAITWINTSAFRFLYNNSCYFFDLNGKTISLLASAPKEAEDLDFEPLTNKLAYTINNNLFVNVNGKPEDVPVITTDGQVVNKKDMITNDGTYGIVNGKAVHRNEFGINKGTFFSPKGTRIAYYKLYEGMVPDYKLMEINSNDSNHKNLTRPTSFQSIKYPMAGNKSHEAHVYIYDFARKRNLEVVTTGDAEQYLTNIAWSLNEDYLYIAIVNRAQNEMTMNMYDGTTGVFIKTLFTETHPKYVEPEKPMVFLKSDPNKFIWFSERDGYNHLYLYNHKGELLNQLTKGKNAVTDIIGFDPKGTFLIYNATSEDGLSKIAYKLDLKTLKSIAINGLEGQHNTLVNDEGTYALDQLSSTSIPRRVTLFDTKGRELSLLLNAKNPIGDYKSCNIKIFSIPSTDKLVKLNCRMILPPGFDSTKKYPVIVYVYGGPHAQMITNNWLGGADMWLYMMAQQGYITFTLDNRGSMNRGLEFENAIHRHFGKIEMEDQLAGVSYLKNQKYIDPTRLGVFGWSFGGFMSTGLMTKTPETFKVGVAGGAVIDWRMYEIMYTERYMDSPQENPDGYADADLTNYAKNLKGRLLLIHGTNDNVVLWQHTLTFLKKCVDEGVQADYFVYPGHEHNVLGPDRVHLMKKITIYFKDFL